MQYTEQIPSFGPQEKKVLVYRAVSHPIEEGEKVKKAFP